MLSTIISSQPIPTASPILLHMPDNIDNREEASYKNPSIFKFVSLDKTRTPAGVITKSGIGTQSYIVI